MGEGEKPTVSVIIPAAGLGTRMSAASRAKSKKFGTRQAGWRTMTARTTASHPAATTAKTNSAWGAKPRMINTAPASAKKSRMVSQVSQVISREPRALK